MRVHVDQDACCGAGQCVLAAPDVFDQREEDGVVYLLIEQVGPELQPAVREAVQCCPAGAIWLESP